MISRTQYTRNFSVAELASNDGGSSHLRMDPILMDRLQGLRDIWGQPLIITSGIRSPELNLKCGGVPTSRHLRGLALDLSISNLTGALRHEFIGLCFRLEFDGIGISQDFIHLDIGRPTKATWVYG